MNKTFGIFLLLVLSISIFVDIKDLKGGYKNKISLSDFVSDSKVRYIKVQ